MSASTTIDYSQQLHDAIQATRSSILAQQAAADASGATTLGALDISRRTFADSRFALADAQAGLDVATYLDRKLVNANLTAANNVALAATANARAATATAAVATAAVSIRAAADAIDAVTRDVAGVAGITKSNDVNEPVDRAAKTAVEAVEKVAAAVEILKSLALVANVEAARSRSSGALQAAQSGQKSVAALLGSADTAMAAGSDALAKAQAARSADLNDLFQKSAQFTIAAQDDAALGQAVKVIDAIGNASLHVAVNNAPDKAGDPETPGLQATAWFPLETLESAKELRFFAVPAENLLSFDFEHALKHGHHAKFPLTDTGKLPKKNGLVECSVHLRKDTDDHALKYGSSYSVFFLREPKVLKARATDFSFPTLPVTSTVVLTFSAKPVLFAFPNGAFVAGFEGASHSGKIASYELFFAPTEVYNRGAGAELLIANTLNAASVNVLSPAQACLDAEVAAEQIMKEYVNEMRAFGPVAREPVRQVLQAFKEWARRKSGVTSYAAYFSPFATKAGWQKAGRYYIGRYSDMYGDVLDLERRTYYALALATGALNAHQVQEAANVLSAPSESFPSAVAPEAPIDELAPRKPSKK